LEKNFINHIIDVADVVFNITTHHQIEYRNIIFRVGSNSGAGGARAPTAGNLMEPLLSLAYKFDEEEQRNKRQEGEEGEKSPPKFVPTSIPDHIVDVADIIFDVTTHRLIEFPIRRPNANSESVRLLFSTQYFYFFDIVIYYNRSTIQLA
jgi:hypothetical protein